MSELRVEGREANRMAGKVHCWTLYMRLLCSYAVDKDTSNDRCSCCTQQLQGNWDPYFLDGKRNPNGMVVP